MSNGVEQLHGTAIKWVRGPTGWYEYKAQSEIIADSIQINHVKKVIDMFLRKKQEKAFKRMYSNLSAAPVSKCSAKEDVAWLQISSKGSRECHGYSTLGELLRRLHLAGSVWQQGRFHYVMCLTELIVEKKFSSISGTSRRHLFMIIDTLVQRVLETCERIRQMKKIAYGVMRCMLKKNFYIGSKGTWYIEIERIRGWISKLNTLDVSQRIDLRLSLPHLPIEVQRHIVHMLDDHRDIESLSNVNKLFKQLCDEPTVWKRLCCCHFTKEQLKECEAVLERRRQKAVINGVPDISELTWKVKYHFMLKRFERDEEFADPLLFCERCCTVFWKDSGHPCVDEGNVAVHNPITPKRLVSYF